MIVSQAAANNFARAVEYQTVFPDSPNILPENLYFIRSKIESEIFYSSTTCIFQPYPVITKPCLRMTLLREKNDRRFYCTDLYSNNSVSD